MSPFLPQLTHKPSCTCAWCQADPSPPRPLTLCARPLAGGSKVETEPGASVASAPVTEELLHIWSPAEGLVPLVTQAKAG